VAKSGASKSVGTLHGYARDAELFQDRAVAALLSPKRSDRPSYGSPDC
jgi:hypothetical protein